MQTKLNPKQKKFCDFYLSPDFFGNGVQAYIKAYGLQKDSQKSYSVAKTNASRLLTNANILAYINQQLEKSGFNDAFVDQQLLFLITQNADFSAKLGAIREYNKLRKRLDNEGEENPIITSLRNTFAAVLANNAKQPLIPPENAYY